MSDFDEIVREIRELQEQKKEVEKTLERSRKRLFNLINEQEKKSPSLPTKRIEVALDFFTTCNIDPEDFLITRYPSWDLVEYGIDEEARTAVFQLRKNPEYTSFLYQPPGENWKIGREIQEYDPSLDIETLKLEDPELVSRLVVEHVTYKLDPDALAIVMQTEPEKLAVLERHLTAKKPAQKLSPARKTEE